MQNKIQTSLKNYNSFGIDVISKKFISINSKKELKQAIRSCKEIPIILGEGTNILFKNDIKRTIIKIDIKEIKFRPNTDTHDYEVKMKSVVKFLGNGDKVKVTMRFRGREMAHQRLGLELLNRVENDLVDIGKVENMPKLEGRQMVMLIGPAKHG